MNELTINDIFKSIKVTLDNDRKKRIVKVFEFAEKAHTGQKRRSGEDYFQHSIATAKILAEIGMGSKTISAGLLHDVPEDTHITLQEINETFGEEIGYLVEGITKLGKIKLRETKEEYFLENLRKMFLAMAADVRVVIIKLADRLHNMQTLNFNPPEKQLRISRETMEIYVPLADRLGIGEIKSELEDLAFKYLDSENYNNIKNLQTKHYKEGEAHINEFIQEVKKEFKKNNIQIVNIYGRAKYLHSLFLKLQKNDFDMEKIYDLIAVRIIVPSLGDCYEALGIVHKKYRPMIGRIKDYISLPKPNGYQSIHTTVFGPQGKIIEVQLRTEKMHSEAEFGIASHWIYNENKRRNWRNYFRQEESYSEKEIAWIKQLREWQNETKKNNEEFITGLKIDFFKHRIFAITPQGDVIDLPEGATPVDFAYAIHSEIGDRITGAKADGKMISLDYAIQNGQMIEILSTKEDKVPSRDWLQFVKTSTAKYHIKKRLKKENNIL